MAVLLRKLRAGYAEQGEDWLRTELGKQNQKELRMLAVAAGVQQKSAGRSLTKPELSEALSQSIVGEQASWGIGADEPASQQKLQELRAGYAEQGEAWLRSELDKQNREELRGLAVAASVRQKSAGRTLSKADLLDALSQSIVGEQASWGIGVLDDCPCQLLLQRGVSVVARWDVLCFEVKQFLLSGRCS
ncbi:unnamed protein product [Symbiodinium sp. CCMP2592]|nr:unnamed protein product [Symbiodinium sp. CCMP2592]